MARLGDIIEQIRGVSYKPEDLRDTLDDNSVTLLRANNIQDGKLNFDDVVYIDKRKVKLAQYLKEGDILVCTSSGSKDLVGKAAYVISDAPAVFGAFCKIVRTKSGNSQFIGHYFDSPSYRRKISDLAAGVNINNIRNEHIDELIIPVPSSEEQEEIVSILNTINRLISLRKQQLAKLEELVKSRFIELFGGINDSRIYPYKAVKELTDVISGGTPSREASEYWKDGTIPWVKTTELHNNIITEIDEYITKAGLDNSSAKLVPVGTILIAMYGQGKTRGMTGYLGVEACTNQACACILPSNSVNQKFLWQYFVLSYDNLRDMAKGGNQPNLNGNIIKNYPVLYPPIELQNQFAVFVEQTDKAKSAVQQSLNELETLKKALMQKYFG